jgi:polysaccharide biosynthesis/export protein
MRRMTCVFALLCVVLVAAPAASQPAPLVARPGDRVTVSVENQPDVSGRYVVEGDGSLALPLVGRLKVAGLAEAALAAEVARALRTYLKEPRVRAAIERPRRAFIFGAVKTPGTYELPPGGMRILELLIQAQYSGISEVLLVRRPGAFGPVLPDQAAPSEVMRVNLREIEKALESGDLSRNLRLESGDTVFVPEVDPNLVHVDGEVRGAGSFAVPDGTTVRQVLALAGGPTEKGAMHRVRVMRLEEGEQRAHRVDLDDPVKPGDTVVVPEVFSLPGVPVPPGILRSSDPAQSAIRLGSAVSLTPVLTFTQFGFDTNVLNEPTDPETAFVAELTPQLQATVDLPRVVLQGTTGVGLAYINTGDHDRVVSPRHELSGRFVMGKAITLTGSFGTGYLTQRFTAEFDARVRRHERNSSAAIELGPWRRVKFDASYSDVRRRFPNESFATLTENVRGTTARAHFALSPLTSVFLSTGFETLVYPLRPNRKADTASFRVGAEFKRRALVEGRAYVGLTRYEAVDDTVPDGDSLGAGVMLWHTWRDRTQVGVRVERAFAPTIHEEYPYAVSTGTGAWAQTRLSSRFDVVVETLTDRYDYRQFQTGGDVTSAIVPERTVRYAAQLGVTVFGSRIALEVSQTQRLGRADLLRSRDYTGWRTNILIDASYRFLRMQRNEGSSIRGRDGFRAY